MSLHKNTASDLTKPQIDLPNLTSIKSLISLQKITIVFLEQKPPIFNKKFIQITHTITIHHNFFDTKI